ncbi:MAG: oxygen-independent coproporphyrinogen III oxidase-like protein [Nevskia sp.]|nr:oxygen-independent coproporphyrinogen III oxidase-like protein [Nevskia sp.]
MGLDRGNRQSGIGNRPPAAAPVTDIPLSLYVHFPWCVRKCPYCDFNSHAVRGEIPEQEYIQALIRDLDFELRFPVPGSRFPPVQSIFLGGGTPSLFSAHAIGALLEAVAARLALAADAEVTLEANPGTADAGHFAGYRAAGVNRLSIGVQSLDDAQLRRLGRIHDSGQAVAAYRAARAAGFANVNLDLMFALPQQTPAQAAADLRQAIALAPEHVSYYQLTLEPNTEFARQPPPLPDDEIAWAMQESGQALLAQAGYAQYEVSAYARPGLQSRHNRNYWTFGDYLGIGAGAHGKRSGGASIVRRARHKHPRTYLAQAGSAAALQEETTVAPAELPFEYAMNALRLNEGFDPADFAARTGLAPGALEPALARARRRGLLEEAGGRVRASALGRAHLNALLREFL